MGRPFPSVGDRVELGRMVREARAVRRILVLHPDPLYRDIVQEVFACDDSGSECRLAANLPDAVGALASEYFDLFVSGTDLPDGDIIDLLFACTREPRRAEHILVISSSTDERLLSRLRALPIAGIVDPWVEGLVRLREVLHAAVTGSVFWSQSMLQRLRDLAGAGQVLDRILSPVDQIMFSVIGAGCDDDQAARQLGLSPDTINEARRKIYRLFGIQHKGDLVRVAVQRGFVRFSRTNVIRPGFSMTLAQCSLRKMSLAPELFPCELQPLLPREWWDAHSTSHHRTGGQPPVEGRDTLPQPPLGEIATRRRTAQPLPPKNPTTGLTAR
jgi:DNA-binding NarL/FixJ family response regulator